MWRRHSAFCLTTGEQHHKVTNKSRPDFAGSSDLVFLLMGTRPWHFTMPSGVVSLFYGLLVLFCILSYPMAAEMLLFFPHRTQRSQAGVLTLNFVSFVYGVWSSV